MILKLVYYLKSLKMINRREFIKKTVALGMYSAFYPLSKAIGAVPNKNIKMLILGIDGMDHSLAWKYMQKGILPNFSKLAKTGSLQVISSSFPPQSPVAWSNFSIGASSHVHGIYDFIHRDPATMIPTAIPNPYRFYGGHAPGGGPPDGQQVHLRSPATGDP